MDNLCCAILRHAYTKIICAVQNFLNKLMSQTDFFCIDDEEAARHEKRIGNSGGGGDNGDSGGSCINISGSSSKFCASKV
jgi:hypothetical protein